MFTGLSGSGKSSLAFDTIYAEGQRRYVESLSAYARQFLEMMQKPDVDQIDGLSPAISIEQKTTSKNPRSTVGTVTEIYDYMRLLWARVGVPYSPATGLPIESQTVSQMVDRVLALPEGTRIYVLAPVVRGRKGEYRKELAEFLRKGYQRVKIDGAFYEIQEVKPLDKKFTHDIDVVVDRLVVKGDIGTRLADLLEQCLKLADGMAVVELADSKATGAAANRGRNATHERIIFSEKFACPVSGFTIPEIEPRLFSFNNPFGACPECGGLGRRAAHRRRSGHPRQGRHLAQGRHRALGEIVVALLHPDADGAGEALPLHARDQMEGPGRRKRRTPSCTAPARTRSNSSMTTACAATRPRSRSKASSPIWSAASRKPKASGRARTCRNISPTCPATSATAPASSPRRSASRSAGSISRRWPSCRCAAPANGSPNFQSS